jgi:hypothetical protein
LQQIMKSPDGSPKSRFSMISSSSSIISSITTRNVLTSDPLISSLNRHNGWSMKILWWKMIVKNGTSLMIEHDESTRIVIIVYDDIGPSWRLWRISIIMGNLRRPHQQSDVAYTWQETTSAIWRGIHMADM